MIDEPVPTMPEMVPASRPTMRTKKKPNTAVFRDSLMLTSWWQQAQVTTS